MAKLREVATTAELMKLLEESGILNPLGLRKAKAVAAETGSCRLLARRLVAQHILTRWQAGQLLVGWTKLRLGKYVLRSQVGRGNFGRVFLAQHVQLEREVAIKTLSRRFTPYPEIVERFLADAREVAALDHRNIVHVFDVDSGDDQFYMVMEYVRGVDLQQQVEQTGPLAIDAAAHYVSQAADGLAQAHQQGVVHRDLQPTNLMIDDKGVVKIVGWGIGRLAGMRRKLGTGTEDRTVASKSGYIAPEQLEGSDRSDARSDIYALGCTAYYLLTGQTPPPAPADRAGPAAAATATAVDIAELRSDIPDDFAAVIRRMMASDPAARFASAADIVQALQPWTRNHLEATPPPVSRASESDDRAFTWTPEPTDVRRHARPPEAANSAIGAIGRRLSVVSRLPRWSLIALLAVAALVVVGLCFALIHWWSKPDTSASWTAPQRRGPAIIAPPRMRKRDGSGSPGSGVGVKRLTPGGEGEPSAAAETPADAPPAATPTTGSTPDMSAPTPDPNTAAPPSAPSDGGAETPPAAPAPEPPPSTPPPATTPPPQSDAPPPEPPPNPWRDLSTAVDLPPLVPAAGAPAASEPFSLGPIAAPWTDACSVTLLGRTTAGVRGGHFECTPQTNGSDPSWQVSLTDDKSTEPAPRVVATVRLEQDHLRFQWDAAAPGMEGAAQLSNCVLRWTNGTQTHDLRLRTPLRAEPLQIDLKKQSTAARAKVVTPPDAKQVRFQITAVDEPLPRSYTLSPAEPIAVTNAAKLQMSLGPDAESQVLLLELMPELKTVFQLRCEAYFRVSPAAKPEVLTTKRVAGVELQVAQNQELANQISQQKREIVIGTAATDPLLKNRQDDMNKAAAYLAECSKMTQNMAALAEIRTAVVAGAAIHYRVFFLADDCEVELVRTGPDAE